MAQREVNDRWQHEMAPFFMNLDSGTPDRSFVSLEEIFHLDEH